MARCSSSTSTLATSVRDPPTACRVQVCPPSWVPSTVPELPTAQPTVGEAKRTLVSVVSVTDGDPKTVTAKEKTELRGQLAKARGLEDSRAFVRALRKRFGLTVVIIEHILKLVMDTCETVSVLEHGEKVAEGTPDEIKGNHRVIEAYLGKEMKDEEVRAYMRSA